LPPGRRCGPRLRRGPGSPPGDGLVERAGRGPGRPGRPRRHRPGLRADPAGRGRRRARAGPRGAGRPPPRRRPRRGAAASRGPPVGPPPVVLVTPPVSSARRHGPAAEARFLGNLEFPGLSTKVAAYRVLTPPPGGY